MFSIYCPYCEEHRSEEEFHAKGQAHIARPEDPDQCTDAQWGEFLYVRDNPKGLHSEQWYHAVGCRKFFNVLRDTQSYVIHDTYKVGEQPSSVSEAPGVSQAKSTS